MFKIGGKKHILTLLILLTVTSTGRIINTLLQLQHTSSNSFS